MKAPVLSALFFFFFTATYAQETREKHLGLILGKLVQALEQKERKPDERPLQKPVRLTISRDKLINAAVDLPSQLIILNRGLLGFTESVPEMSDDLLAGVLGHQLAHLFHRHGTAHQTDRGGPGRIPQVPPISYIDPWVAVLAETTEIDKHLQYDRQEEREADLLGLQLACRAEFDPVGLLIFYHKLSLRQLSSEMDFLRTHPTPPESLIRGGSGSRMIVDALQAGGLSVREAALQGQVIHCLEEKSREEDSKADRVGSGSRPSQLPQVLYNPDPPYTARAEEEKIQGTVQLQCTLTTAGRLRDCRVLQGLGYGLDESAVEIVKLWRFLPAQSNGHPVSMIVTINFRFDPP